MCSRTMNMHSGAVLLWLALIRYEETACLDGTLFVLSLPDIQHQQHVQ